MIREPSGQDRPLSKPAVGRPWRRWLSGGAVALAVIAGIGYVVRGWLGAERSVDRARIRIATVQRGTLVRDVVADGRVVAASSPTLYAIAAGTIDFHVRAGDKVTRGQSLATVASPELQSRLTQEQATMAGLEAGVGRAELDVEHGRANAQKLIAQAEVDRQGAAREVEINNQMFAKGVIPELELRRSEDALKKTEIAVGHARTEAALQGRELVFDLGTRKQGLDRQRAVVRELERQVAALDITSPNALQRAALLATDPEIAAADLALPAVPPRFVPGAPGSPAAPPGPPGLADELDRPTIEAALARAGGVIAQAAADLGLSRQALYRRMEKLGVCATPSARDDPPATDGESAPGRTLADRRGQRR